MLESVRYEFVNSGVSVLQILQLWSEKEPGGGKFVSANTLIGRKESAPPPDTWTVLPTASMTAASTASSSA